MATPLAFLVALLVQYLSSREEEEEDDDDEADMERHWTRTNLPAQDRRPGALPRIAQKKRCQR
jgi:hypothetical protein